MDIQGGVGHRRGSDLEEVATVVGAGQGLNGTVVLSSRLRPGDQGTTGTRIVGRGQITAESQNHRVLGVEDRHAEGLGGLVAMDIQSRVGNGRGSHGEGVTAGVGAGEGLDVTVV